LQHEKTVVRARLSTLKGWCIRTHPVEPAHAIGRTQLAALTDEHHIGPGQCGGIGQQLLDEFRPDAGGVSSEKSDLGFHIDSSQRGGFMKGR
jgi:hypothetical protein